MKKLKVTVLILAAATCFPYFASCAPQEPPEPSVKYDLEYNVVLNTERGSQISPLIYGDFFEHIPGAFYDSLWAETIMDRKFYYQAGREGLSPWHVTGKVESSEDCYSENGYAAVLKAGGAIFQKATLQKKKYEGYFYASGNGTLGVSVGQSKQSVAVSGGWKKYSFTAVSDSVAEQEISFTAENGEIKLDSLSLMPEDNYFGMRKDMLDVLKELGATNYRWPGGNFVSGYDWQWGIGDKDKRVCVRNEAWFADTGNVQDDIRRLKSGNFYSKIEPNDMGVDEYMAMCSYLGSEPFLAVNTGNGTPENAAAMVEYCNGATTTEYGAKRAANGHSEPYGVTYWGVGNEMQGDWQIGHMSVADYVVKHNKTAELMKNKDGSILLSGCGDNAGYWTEEMFKACSSNLDYISEHIYAPLYDGTDTAAKHVLAMVNQVEMRIKNHRELIKKYPRAEHVKIAFDEWAYSWDHVASMRDVLGIASALNLFVKNADVVGITNYAPSVFRSDTNTAPALLFSSPTGVKISCAGLVRAEYAKTMRGYCAEAFIRQTDKSVQLGYQACIGEDGKTVTLAVVNATEKAVALNFNLGSVTNSVVIAEGEFSPVKTETGALTKAVSVPLSVSLFTVAI